MIPPTGQKISKKNPQNDAFSRQNTFMINFKLNGQSLQIPTAWNEVTFGQYLEIFGLKDDVIQLVAILTKQDYEYLKNATILGLDKLLEAISFINQPPEFPGYVDTCGPYHLPPNAKGQFNIQYESLGQFEDARKVMMAIPKGDVKYHTECYAKYCAIYLQKIRDKEYNPTKALEMAEEIKGFPAYQVITLGSFFFLKLLSSLNGTRTTSPSTVPSRKKLRRVLKPSGKSSGSTGKSMRSRLK
jgi:hypothetical protein